MACRYRSSAAVFRPRKLSVRPSRRSAGRDPMRRDSLRNGSTEPGSSPRREAPSQCRARVVESGDRDAVAGKGGWNGTSASATANKNEAGRWDLMVGYLVLSRWLRGSIHIPWDVTISTPTINREPGAQSERTPDRPAHR